VKQENIFGIICFSANFIATQQRKKWRKVWNITGNCLSLQRQEVILGYPGRIPRGQD